MKFKNRSTKINFIAMYWPQTKRKQRKITTYMTINGQISSYKSNKLDEKPVQRNFIKKDF